jgi:DNA-binding SARP family transcriptional activator/streptogramin lyase
LAVSFRILGPLEVRKDGGELPLGAGRQRALLALLLVHANELVSSEQLIEELWSGRPSPSAQKTLQGWVSQLRRALTADTILTRSSGYVLVATDTDAGEFERLTKLAAEQDAPEAVRTLERALALWRGRAFEEFEYEEWPQLEIGRLEELRLSATEQRIEAELELGHHAQLVPELETLVADHPLREQLRGQLMVALYRSGRHAEALDVYRRGRQVLHQELGLEPSPFLARLERQILSHDPTLSAPARRFLPVGTVTILFTDIESSTQLLEQLGERYADVLAQSHRILGDAVERCEGREVDNQGDSFFFAFASAKSAVAAAVIGQRELAEHRWPDRCQVGVRMGLHTGEPAVGEEQYAGLGMQRAARIGGVGGGGQVLLSNATRELVEDEIGGVTVRELGTYRLRDIDRPEPLFQLDIEGLRTEFPPLDAERFREPNPLRRHPLLAGVVAAAILGVVAAAIAIVSRGGPTPTMLPNSLIRINPKTLKATQAVPVGDAPDLVIAAGGYLWVTNNIFRDTPASGIRNAGDHTLYRVDPATGEAEVVGGGLSPCGLTADPSGDVWVANCFTPGTGQTSNIVRVDPTTLKFSQPISVPGGTTFYRGMTYGSGSLWLADHPTPDSSSYVPHVTQVNPRTRAVRTIRVVGALSARACASGARCADSAPGSLAWSENYGDLWITAFSAGSLTRLNGATRATQTIHSLATNPASVVVDGNVVWVADWSAPHVVRLNAIGPARPVSVRLPVRNKTGCVKISCVWHVAAGAGFIWATTPRDDALWRINPTTNHVTRLGLPYPPTGVTVDRNNVWVTVRHGR